MARKPPARGQRSLFPTGSGDSPELPDNLIIDPEGGHHAVQDNHLRNVATTTADARPAPQEPQTPADAGTLRQGVEEQPRSVEGNARANEAEKQPEPNRERGP